MNGIHIALLSYYFVYKQYSACYTHCYTAKELYPRVRKIYNRTARNICTRLLLMCHSSLYPSFGSSSSLSLHLPRICAADASVVLTWVSGKRGGTGSIDCSPSKKSVLRVVLCAARILAVEREERLVGLPIWEHAFASIGVAKQEDSAAPATDTNNKERQRQTAALHCNTDSHAFQHKSFVMESTKQLRLTSSRVDPLSS